MKAVTSVFRLFLDKNYINVNFIVLLSPKIIRVFIRECLSSVLWYYRPTLEF